MHGGWGEILTPANIHSSTIIHQSNRVAVFRIPVDENHVAVVCVLGHGNES
jgi:hypothetical protein